MAWSPGTAQDGEDEPGGRPAFVVDPAGIADDFGLRLHLDRVRKDEASSSGGEAGGSGAVASQQPEVAAGPQQPAPAAAIGFVFAAQTAAGPALRQPPRRSPARSKPSPPPRRREAAPAAGAPAGAPAPPLFVFGAASQQQQQQQQQQPVFVSISQVHKTPGAPPVKRQHRRRPAPVPARASPVSRAPLNFGGLHISQPPTAAAVPLPQPRAEPPSERQREAHLERQLHDQAVSMASYHRTAGNEAYSRQEYDVAGRLYTQALLALDGAPSARAQHAPLLYCNRAAAFLATGRPAQALHDCRLGLQHCPTFIKCHLRMASCHARLGAYEAGRAALHSARAAAGTTPELIAAVDAKNAELDSQEALLMAALAALGHDVAPAGAPTPPAAQRVGFEAAVAQFEAAAQHVPHSEVVHAARAEALLRGAHYTRALAAAAAPVHADARVEPAGWRTWIEAQAAFHSGRSDAALASLRLLAEGGPAAAPSAEPLLGAVVALPSAEEAAQLAAALEQAGRLKTDGNEAVAAGNYAAAVEAYSAALKVGTLSQVLASQLFANRAAAHQGLKQFALALADCARAVALDAQYSKAHSRRAALLTELRFHEEAVAALQAALAGSGLAASARHEYQRRLQSAQAAAAAGARRAQPPHSDFYSLLGLQRACAVADVRKVYKKLALTLHPDKLSFGGYTVQLGGAGSRIAAAADAAQARLQEGASWLFKCLNEACDVLSDPEKRQQLDWQLDGRNHVHGHGYGHGHGGFGGQYAPPPRRPAGPYGGFGYGGYGGFASHGDARGSRSYGGYWAYV